MRWVGRGTFFHSEDSAIADRRCWEKKDDDAEKEVRWVWYYVYIDTSLLTGYLHGGKHHTPECVCHTTK